MEANVSGLPSIFVNTVGVAVSKVGLLITFGEKFDNENNVYVRARFHMPLDLAQQIKEIFTKLCPDSSAPEEASAANETHSGDFHEEMPAPSSGDAWNERLNRMGLVHGGESS